MSRDPFARSRFEEFRGEIGYVPVSADDISKTKTVGGKTVPKTAVEIQKELKEQEAASKKETGSQALKDAEKRQAQADYDKAHPEEAEARKRATYAALPKQSEYKDLPNYVPLSSYTPEQLAKAYAVPVQDLPSAIPPLFKDYTGEELERNKTVPTANLPPAGSPPGTPPRQPAPTQVPASLEDNYTAWAAANPTVLVVAGIALVAGIGYLWYTREPKEAPAQ